MKLGKLIADIVAKKTDYPQSVVASLETATQLWNAFTTSNPQTLHGGYDTFPGEVGGFISLEGDELKFGELVLGKVGFVPLDEAPEGFVGTFHTHPSQDPQISLAPSLQDFGALIKDERLIFLLVEARLGMHLVLKTAASPKKLPDLAASYQEINNNVSKPMPRFSGTAYQMQNDRLKFVKGIQGAVNTASQQACIFLANSLKMYYYCGTTGDAPAETTLSRRQ
jgi:hypothetical protein